MAAAPKFKIPKSLSACADLYYTLRNERLAKANEVKPIQEKESAVREYLIENLPKSQTSGIAGKLPVCGSTRKRH